MNAAFKINKHRGAALIAVILVGFILLSCFSLVAFNIAVGTMRVEEWQTDNYHEQQLLFLARSAAVAVGGYLRDNPPGLSDALDKRGAVRIVEPERGLSASLDIMVSADVGSNVLISVTASGAEDKKASLTCLYNRVSGQIYGWDVK